MATYVVLLNFTEQGVADSGGTVSRANAAATALKKLGGKMRSVLWTMGPYDAVSIIEAPDDETVTAFCLAVGGQGTPALSPCGPSRRPRCRRSSTG